MAKDSYRTSQHIRYNCKYCCNTTWPYVCCPCWGLGGGVGGAGSPLWRAHSSCRNYTGPQTWPPKGKGENRGAWWQVSCSNKSWMRLFCNLIVDFHVICFFWLTFTSNHPHSFILCQHWSGKHKTLPVSFSPVSTVVWLVSVYAPTASKVGQTSQTCSGICPHYHNLNTSFLCRLA